jgi:hypothetical protein
MLTLSPERPSRLYIMSGMANHDQRCCDSDYSSAIAITGLTADNCDAYEVFSLFGWETRLCNLCTDVTGAMMCTCAEERILN